MPPDVRESTRIAMRTALKLLPLCLLAAAGRAQTGAAAVRGDLDACSSETSAPGTPVETANGLYVLPADPLPPTAVAGDGFSIVLLPDTQSYSENYDLSPSSSSSGHRYARRFSDQVEWIVAQASPLRIAFVSHVGDVVQNFANNNESEWDVARFAMNKLHPGHDPRLAPWVPYAVTLGNHDFDSQTQGSLYATKFVSEYGPARFKNAQGSFHPYYKGSDLGWTYVVNGVLKEKGRGQNSWQFFQGGTYRFLHLSLQCAATNGTLAWAQTIVDANPGVRTIVTTHAFITGGGTLSGFPGGFVGPASMGRLVPGVTNDAAGIWNRFIRTNDQIFLVLCGHSFEQEHIVLQNEHSKPVLVYEAAFQINSHGGKIRRLDQGSQPWLYNGPDDDDRNGSGWLGLLVFDPGAGHVTWYTYSPTLGVWARDISPHDYPPGMTTYPWGSDVVVRTQLDLDDASRFAP